MSTYIKIHVLFCLPGPLLQACRSPVTPLSPSCCLPVAKKHPAALLSLSCRSDVALSCRFPVASLSPLALLPSCRLPLVFLSLILSLCLVSCCFPVATVSPPCRPPVALLMPSSCSSPVAFLSLACCFLSLSCRFPAAFLSSSCGHPVVFLSPPCRSLPHFTSHDRAYHNPNPIQHLARVLGDTDSRAHIQELQEKLQPPLYHAALRPTNVPAHLQKRGIQLLREQLAFLTRVARWLARKHIHVPEEHTRCRCDHNILEDWEHFKKCPLHTGRDTLVGWSPAEALRQHKGWPTHSHAHQANEHLFGDPLVKEATMRGAVTQALHRHLAKHTESPMEAVVHLQLEAVRRAAAQMVHRKHLLF